MGRGDYNTKYRGKGMQPSHNTVWGEQDVSEEEFEDRWKLAFGKVTPRKEITGKCKCTCDFRELHHEGKHYIIKGDCEQHGPGYRKEVNTTIAIPEFSKRQKKKVRDFVMYGNQTLTDVMDRN